MENIFDNVMKILSLIFSFVALVVSIFALIINQKSYDINIEKFKIDTVENLSISVGVESFDSLNLKLEECDNDPSYRIGITLCFVNNSNLPIYINQEYISREQSANGLVTSINSAEIEELDLPILIEPLETKYVSCYVRITMPELINQYIVEEFINKYNNEESIKKEGAEFLDISDLDINEIGTYLFIEKNTDLIGNEVVISMNKGEKQYKYNPTIPFHISFWTTRGNYFSTEFYNGLYLDIKKAIEKYHNLNLEISYGEKDKMELVSYYLQNHMDVVFSVWIVVVVIFFLKRMILKRYKTKSKMSNEIESSGKVANDY